MTEKTPSGASVRRAKALGWYDELVCDECNYVLATWWNGFAPPPQDYLAAVTERHLTVAHNPPSEEAQ